MQGYHNHISIRRGAIVLGLGLVPVVAGAQDIAVPSQSTEAAGGPATSQDVAEIVVTGQKRAENVQAVPKSVDVVGRERLQQSGVTRITDLGLVAPSISGTLTPFSGAPAIRGISSFSFSVGLQGQTGIVVDDVPQSPFSTLANELGDVERVEVFPGPQSTLSGRNAAGGLLNIVTRRPSHTLSANFLGERTTDGQTRLQGFLTGPLTQQLAFSLSSFFNDWGGNLRNIQDQGKRLGGYDTWGVRTKLLWEPTSSLNFLLTGFYIKNKTNAAAILSAGPYISIDPRATYLFAPTATLAQLFPGITPHPFNRDVSYDVNGISRTKDRGIDLKVNLDVGPIGTIGSITNFTKSSLPRIDNFIGANLPFGRRVDTGFDSKQVSQELRLVSPGNQPFTYLLGAIYSDNDISYPYVRLQLFPVNWLRGSSFASIAAYGRGTLTFAEKWSLSGGLRYQRDKQKYSWNFLATTSPFNSTALRSGRSNYDFFSGEASLKYAFTPDVNAYVTVSRSETGQAYDLEDQADALAGTLQPIKSEKVKNIEVGLKTQSLDHRLTANFNAFYARYSNYQIQTVEPLAAADPTKAPVIRIFPIGKVETKGLEFVGSFRASHVLNFTFNAAYLNAKIKDYPNAACYPRQTAAAGCVNALQANLAGNPMPNAPRVKLNGGANYVLELPSMPFDGNLGLFARYQSKVRGDLFGNPAANLPGYLVVNASAGVTGRNDRFSLTFFVNNLFNKKYYLTRGDDTFLNVAGAPTIPAATGGYARDSFRYGGVRLTTRF